MQGGAASICGEAGCHFGVRAERWGFKTFIASDVNEIFSLALACKSLLLHVTWARETASSACFWIPLDTLGAFFFFFFFRKRSSSSADIPRESGRESLACAPLAAARGPLSLAPTLHGERVRAARFHSSRGFKHALALYVS